MEQRTNTGGHFLSENPVVRRISRINDTSTSHACSYRGIAGKLIFFIIAIIIGVGIGLLFKYGGIAGDEIIFSEQLYEDSAPSTVTKTEMFAVIIGGLVFIISPLLATFIPSTSPVTGALYCASTGFIITWLAVTFADVYMGPVLLALVITLMIVATMGFLYGMGIVRVTQKMRTFLMVALIASCGVGLISFILSLIPFTRGLMSWVYGNPVLSIGGSAFMVLIATLFLLVDFDTIQQCVENGLPKKYEWYASFGLIFGVIWLYFKVLELLLKIMARSRD